MTVLEKGILVTMIACVILFIVSVVLVGKALGELDEVGGLRAAIERLWCGKDGCPK